MYGLPYYIVLTLASIGTLYPLYPITRYLLRERQDRLHSKLRIVGGKSGEEILLNLHGPNEVADLLKAVDLMLEEKC